LPRRSPSLRFRLLCLSALTIAFALSIAAVALVTIFNRHLERRVEQELDVRLVELASGFGLNDDGLPAITKELADPRYDQPYSGAYWQVTDESGPILRSESLWDQHLTYAGPLSGERAFETTGPQDSTLYALARDVKLTAGEAPRTFRLAVALDHAELQALGASFLSDVTQSLAVIGVVLILGAWVQIHLGLRPLRRLHDQLALIQHGRSSRLQGRFPSEIAPLVDNLNKLIDRQEESVRKARERAGDLAHGLKTPLTILEGEARRLEKGGNQGGADSMREQINHMRSHVDRQLARARSHGASVAGGACTDVTKTFDRLFGLMKRMPRSERLQWLNDLPPELRIRVDPDDFGEIAGNLLDNARLWATGRVRVSAELDGETVRLFVDDDGPGVSAELLDRIAMRGESGAIPGEGNGLGLAIVNDLLALYGSSLTIETAPLGGCRAAFVVQGWVEPGVAPVRQRARRLA
jgi:signal transduction histidine kinase